jgi:LysM repeat protein
MRPGERVEQQAAVYRRSFYDYFRATHGLLVQTNERLLFVGIVPTVLPSPKDLQAPPSIDRRSLAIDSIGTLAVGRVFAGTANGLAVHDVGNVTHSFAAESDQDLTRLRTMVAAVQRHQAEARADAERKREQARAMVKAAEQPVYHFVQRGEALIEIARRYNTLPESIRVLNNLESDRIKAGERLLVKRRAGFTTPDSVEVIKAATGA